jgi:hypothetical protein
VNGRSPSQHEGCFFSEEPLRKKIVAPQRIKWTERKKRKTCFGLPGSGIIMGRRILMMDISKLQLHRVTERDVKNDVHLLKLITDSMLSIQFQLQAASAFMELFVCDL